VDRLRLPDAPPATEPVDRDMAPVLKVSEFAALVDNVMLPVR
jgi:hypothetical protein